MYKVFVNDTLIIFQEKQVDTPVDSNVFKVDSIFEFGDYAPEIIHKIKSKNLQYIVVSAEVLDFEWHRFTQVFYHVHAAGGLALDEHARLLFIKRNHVWDLPKGHVEKNEKFDQAALREVEEECGNLSLELQEFLITTHHIYFFKEKWRLKSTHWYRMKVNKVIELIPQIEEGIEEVAFFDTQDLSWIKSQTYPNILSVIESAGIIMP